MNRVIQIVCNWLAVFLILFVNYNARAISGLHSAEISGLYPNHFVPASYTFGIWILIYLLHILFAAYSTFMLSHKKRAEHPLGQLAQKITPLFWITCVLNASWLLAWHNLQIGLSVLIMIALFFTLLTIFRIITVSERSLSLGYFEHVSLETPFIIYFSWIAISLMANLTAYFVSIGWGGSGISERWWSVAMVFIAGCVGVWFSLYWRRPAYTAVIVWAVIGIYVEHASISNPIKYITIAACLTCLPAAAIGFWMKRKLLFKAGTQIA